MHLPSRRMPKIVTRPTARLMGWGVLLLFLTGAVWSLWQLASTTPTLTALCVVALALTLFAVTRQELQREKAHLRALAAKRTDQSICEFARDFDPRQVDTWIIRAVYEQLQTQLMHLHPAFPIRADDRLKEDLLLDDDDLDMDLAPGIEARTGRSLGDITGNPYFGNVRTVRELVLCFNTQPKPTDLAALQEQPHS